MNRTTGGYFRSGRLALAIILAIAVLVPLGTSPAAAQEVYRRAPMAQSATGDATASPTGQDPVAPPARTGDEVVLEVGDDFAAVVASHPPGTHFRIAAGVHVGQQVTPRTGDVFTGDAGAVMTGAVPVGGDAAQQRGGVWVLSGQTAEAFVWNGGFHGETEDGRERDAANNDLWNGDQRLTHAPSRTAVDSPDEWFFDYDADEIIVGVDPAATSLALSTPWHAFNSEADDVTIQHLTITRYASYAQHGAVFARGSSWSVTNVTVTENHGAGITIGTRGVVADSRITANGQIGVTAWYGDGIRVERNEIAHNRTLAYSWGWEGGGTKFKETTNAVFANNWVHSNHGPGIWFDIDNTDSLISSNHVEDNLIGILVEISYGAEVSDNVVTNNGADGYGDIGAGLWVSNSSDVEVHHNAFSANRLEILATHYDRGQGAHGRYETRGLNVHHNAISITGPKPTGLRVYTGEQELYDGRVNTFQDNSYQLVQGGPALWWDGDRGPEAWRSLGLDVAGVFSSAPPPPPIRNPFTAVGYGHAA